MSADFLPRLLHFYWTPSYSVISLNHSSAVTGMRKHDARFAFARNAWRFMGNFYTDAISRDARFDSVTRVSDASLLEPATRQLVEGILSAAANMGMELMIYETYRSQDRQQELFNRGVTRLRAVGVHHYGLACDIVRVVGGEPCWKGDFSFLGQLAHSSGLIWGGDWGAPHLTHSFIDSVHVQRCAISRQGDLFAGVWYPDETYNPYDDGQHLFAAARADVTKTAAEAGARTVNSRPNSRRT
jgi:hypothetical protein